MNVAYIAAAVLGAVGALLWYGHRAGKASAARDRARANERARQHAQTINAATEMRAREISAQAKMQLVHKVTDLEGQIGRRLTVQELENASLAAETAIHKALLK